MPNGDCTVGVELRAKVEGLDQKTADLHDVDEQQWEALNKLRDRPPVWAVWAMTALGTTCGVLAGVLGTLLAT